jgi:predicted RNA-binding protein
MNKELIKNKLLIEISNCRESLNQKIRERKKEREKREEKRKKERELVLVVGVVVTVREVRP